MPKFTQYNKKNTQGIANELLCGIENHFGFLPNMFQYMIESPITVQAYLQLNQLVQNTSFSDAERELAKYAISKANHCDFCSSGHKISALNAGVCERTIDALESNKEITNQKDAALIKMCRLLVEEKGFVAHEHIDEFIHAGFTKKQLLECILIVSLKTLATYTNHITNPEINEELSLPPKD